MGILKMLGAAAMGSLEVKTIISSADVLIIRHTNMNPGSVGRAMEKHANEIIKQKIIHHGTDSFNDSSAAMLKLAIYHKNFELKNDTQSTDMLGGCISKLRDAVGNSVRPDVSLEVMAETGC